MSNQILVPSLGESVTEATVSKWLKQVGEKVDSDEPLVELETDKVNVEVPSPLTGTLSSIEVKEGESLEDIKAKLKPKKQAISAEMLDTANTYDDKVAVIRMIVQDESGRVSNVFKNMIQKDMN